MEWKQWFACGNLTSDPPACLSTTRHAATRTMLAPLANAMGLGLGEDPADLLPRLPRGFPPVISRFSISIDFIRAYKLMKLGKLQGKLMPIGSCWICDCL